MDTARLRALGTFPRVQTLLGECITHWKLVPSNSRGIQNPDSLPGALKASVLRAERRGQTWYAWCSEHEVFAMTGNLDEVSSRMHAKPVSVVHLYDD